MSEEEVAKMLDELFNHEYPCDICDNDEWLPFCCDYKSECTSAHIEPIKCWEQFVKHRDKRKH